MCEDNVLLYSARWGPVKLHKLSFFSDWGLIYSSGFLNVNKSGNLDCHVQTTSDPGSLQGLGGAVLLPG